MIPTLRTLPLSRRCFCSTETRLCRAFRFSSTGFLPLRDKHHLDHLDFPIPSKHRPAWLSGYRIEQLTPLLPASLRLIQKRRGRILVPPHTLRKGFVKRILRAREERVRLGEIPEKYDEEPVLARRVIAQQKNPLGRPDRTRRQSA